MENITDAKVASQNNTPFDPPLKLRGGNRVQRGGGVIDLRQSPEYGEYIKSLGWIVVGTNPQIFIRKLGIFGAIAKIQRFNKLNWKHTKNILRENHVWMTKIEPIITSPSVPLLSLGEGRKGRGIGFHQDSWPMLATKTLRIDLTPSLEKIFLQFKKDCRSMLRKLQIQSHKPQVNDFDKFYEIWKKSAKIKHLWIPSIKNYKSLIKCFGNNCFCITVDNLAGSFILIHDLVAYYYYSGAIPEGKKLNLPYFIIWECIKEAKKRGCNVWDFEGIDDDRWPNKGWLGFSHFKKSFGGYEVKFPGSFTKWG